MSRRDRVVAGAAGAIASCALALCACTTMTAPTPTVGMPIDAFLDDLKAQLRDVHWHVRGHALGCDGGGPREVDLRDGLITLQMQRLAQVSAGASVKLVALPLAGLAVSPSLSAETTRKHAEEMTIKLAIAGDTPVIDLDSAPASDAPVARAVNAAIDGFMRSGSAPPCIRLTSLRFQFVIDVAHGADGGFKVVVPAISLDAGASDRNVNTLQIDWAKIESRAIR